MNIRSGLRLGGALLILLSLSGCMGNPAFREGRMLAADGNLEAALPRLQTAAKAVPTNAEYQSAYVRTRELLINRWLEQAVTARRENRISEADKIYRRLLEEDPGNVRALEGIDGIARAGRHGAYLTDAEAAVKKQDYETAMARLRTILAENPDYGPALQLKREIGEKSVLGMTPQRLSAGLRKPITIEFKDTPLRQIFEILSRTSGLNFVFDKDVKGDQRATIFLRNSSVQDALNLLMLTNQLEQRLLDANSILIYPNTPAKLKDYQPLSVKTFLLSNVDAKTASNTLKTILKAKDFVVDEKQNLIVMRDTVDTLRMAEKLLSMQDQAEPEVMLEVAILEVKRTGLLNLGVQWPSQVALSPLVNAAGNVTLNDLRNLRSSTVGATLPAMTIHADKQDGSVNLLANPRIRVRNRELAKIMIGDRIPNITSTSTATGFVSENIQYVDIGLKLEVQPVVNADNEVGIKISLEVSSIVDQFQTKSGSMAYQIGTRTASTVLKLKDGENQVLAGLIRNEETSIGNRLPGLGEVPILGRLFGSQRDDTAKTEIVLSITPRLIRNIRRPDFNMLEFESGTDSSLKIRPDGPVAAAGNSTVVIAGPQNQGSVAATSLSNAEASPESAPTTMSLQGPEQVKVGATFAVQLAIQPGEAITGIPMALAFDSKLLEVLSVTEGDFLKQNEGTTSFSHRIDKSSGQVFATVTRTNKGGASTPGTVLNFTLKALAASPDARITVSTVAPIGVDGRSVSAPSTSPLGFTVSP